MGATIHVVNNQIIISPSILTPYKGILPALDVRSAAVTLVTMILSKSNVELSDAQHILRGYSRLTENLHSLGVDIKYSFN